MRSHCFVKTTRGKKRNDEKRRRKSLDVRLRRKSRRKYICQMIFRLREEIDSKREDDDDEDTTRKRKVDGKDILDDKLSDGRRRWQRQRWRIRKLLQRKLLGKSYRQKERRKHQRMYEEKEVRCESRRERTFLLLFYEQDFESRVFHWDFSQAKSCDDVVNTKRILKASLEADKKVKVVQHQLKKR